MITHLQYAEALAWKRAAESVINAYHKEKANRFDQRFKRFEAGEEFFTDEDLVFAATARCPCGAGLAYPRDCFPGHHWDCSAILKGTAVRSVTHTGWLPFAFYEIKSENSGPTPNHYGTTRPCASSGTT